MHTHGPAGTARRRTASTVLALLATAVLLSSCGGADDGSSAGSAERDAATPAAEDKEARPDVAARVLPAGRDIVYRGEITVRVTNVASASERAESLAREVDGVVFAEETSNTPGSPEESTAQLTLRVPPTEFRTVLKRLAGLGQRLSQAQTAEDVTTQVVDTRSRVASQQRSVARVRALLGEADTIGEVVQIESELARREADLESLEAQLTRLRDVTELATIEVSLVGRAADEPDPDEELGFLTGLRGGWDAFVQIILVGLTVMGALLPFLLTAGLVGVPTWLLVRPRLKGRPAATPPMA